MLKKHCPKCKSDKEISDFGKDKTTKSGFKWACKKCQALLRRDNYIRNREKRILSSKMYAQRNKQKYLVYQRNIRKITKQKVINGYGGKCTCCGESTPEFLTLEHLKKDGKIHRLTKGSKGSAGTYRDVIRRNFPENYTILCCNCNYAERYGAKCPHKLAKGA